MGYHTELNTMLRLAHDDLRKSQLRKGMRISTRKPTAHIYPMNCAILLLAEDWTVLGYCAVRKSELTGPGITVEAEVLSVFGEDESEVYSKRLREALTLSGEFAS